MQIGSVLRCQIATWDGCPIKWEPNGRELLSVLCYQAIIGEVSLNRISSITD